MGPGTRGSFLDSKPRTGAHSRWEAAAAAAIPATPRKSRTEWLTETLAKRIICGHIGKELHLGERDRLWKFTTTAATCLLGPAAFEQHTPKFKIGQSRCRAAQYSRAPWHIMTQQNTRWRALFKRSTHRGTHRRPKLDSRMHLNNSSDCCSVACVGRMWPAGRRDPAGHLPMGVPANNP